MMIQSLLMIIFSSVDLNNINLVDNNFNEYDAKTILSLIRVAW